MLAGCREEIASLEVARLIRPAVDGETRDAGWLPFEVERGHAYGMRVRCDANYSTGRQLGRGEISLGTVELGVESGPFDDLGVEVVVSPARLERLSYRAWVLRSARIGSWDPPLRTVPWRHPEELSRLPVEEYWRYLIPESRRRFGPGDFDLIENERFTWTYDVRLDLRGMSSPPRETRVVVRPRFEFPESWFFVLRPGESGHHRFVVAQNECLELPFP